MYHLSKYEQETTINWCIADKAAYINTADYKVIRKLDKLVAGYPHEYRCTYDSVYGEKQYSIPIELIRFAKPASEAKREAARRNLEHRRK